MTSSAPAEAVDGKAGRSGGSRSRSRSRSPRKQTKEPRTKQEEKEHEEKLGMEGSVGPKEEAPEKEGTMDMQVKKKEEEEEEEEGEKETEKEKEKGKEAKAEAAEDAKESRVPVALVSRPAKRIEAALITVTKNNQGENNTPVFCLAALAGSSGRGRLIRLVPDVGHFWTEKALPRELHRAHLRARDALPDEPTWAFWPAIVGFEMGTLPDHIQGPHRWDDVVARKMTFVKWVEEPQQLYDTLSQMSAHRLSDIWPAKAWATERSLLPDAEVPSLALFTGRLRDVVWREQKSPVAELEIDGRRLRLPYAAHRCHGREKGWPMMRWMKGQPGCLFLLGLSRPFQKHEKAPAECTILLLRMFPGC